MHQTLGENYGYSNYMPNVWIYGQLAHRNDNDENLRIQSPCLSNWSDDLWVIDNNKDESKEQPEQPTNQIITLTGTRVPQNILMDPSTSLRLPQTIPQVHKTQKQNGKAKQKTRLPYATWTWKQPQKQDSQEQKWGQWEKRKWKSILYRCGDLD